MFDESNSFHHFRSEYAISRSFTLRFIQKPFPFVKADRLNGNTCKLRNLSYRHRLGCVLHNFRLRLSFRRRKALFAALKFKPTPTFR